MEILGQVTLRLGYSIQQVIPPTYSTLCYDRKVWSFAADVGCASVAAVLTALIIIATQSLDTPSVSQAKFGRDDDGWKVGTDWRESKRRITLGQQKNPSRSPDHHTLVTACCYYIMATFSATVASAVDENDNDDEDGAEYEYSRCTLTN